MRILKLKINNFGKLTNKEIELKKGINIIYGRNESGKSTLLAFIMGMLYGLSKNKNGKFTSDYERYTPWNGGEFSGKIEYELDGGKKYEVYREFKKKNPIIYNENLEDISKSFNIDKTNGNKFFYDQTGVDEELFKSTIVSMQEEVKLEEKEQMLLIQKMSNLVSTGEDNLSFQKIMNKLNKRQMEEIGTLRSQDRPINIVTKRLEEIKNEKEYLSNFSNKQYEIEEERKILEEQIKKDTEKLGLLKSLQQLQENKQLELEKIKINQGVIKEYREKIEKLKSKKNINEKEVETKKKGVNKISILLNVIFLIILVVSVTILKNDIITSASVVLFLVTLIYIGYTQYKTKMQTNKKKKIQNVENAGIQNEIEILKNSKEKLESETTELSSKIEKEYKEETEKLRNKYIGLVPIEEITSILEKGTVMYDINILQNQISANKVSIHTNEVDMKNILLQMENLSNLEEENAELESEYEELTKKNELITLAKTEIENAYEIMKNNITPKFTNKLSEIIQEISGGKYKNVQLDEENGIIVEAQNGKYVSVKNLSIGTIDQLYLSLRFGAGYDISNENLPIILDETFAYWDDERLENTIKYIEEKFVNRQVILFTCTNREKELIKKMNYSYNYIEL